MAVFPLPVITNAFTIRTFDAITDKNWTYDLNFNPQEWELDAVSWSVTGNQTYLPSIPGSFVAMDLRAEIVTDIGTFLMGSKTLEWGPLSYADTRSWQGTRAVDLAPGKTPTKTGIRMTHQYRLPTFAVVEQVTNITDIVSIVLISRVPNPTTTPNLGASTSDTTPPASGNPLDKLTTFFSGFGAGALIAGGAILLILVLKR